MNTKIDFTKRLFKTLFSISLAFVTAVPTVSSPITVYAKDDTDFSSSYDSSNDSDSSDDSGQTLDEMDMIDTSSSNSDSSDSGGGGTKLSGSLESQLMNYLSAKMNTANTHLDNVDVTSDIEVDLQANPENYRWTAFYRKNKDDDLDTSSKNSDGTYHGFSADKVKAWYQYVDHIKSYNDGKAPEIREYKYPTTTKSDQLDFWADKPGVYDVYGDPYYSKVILTAGVDVELLESKIEYVDVDDTDSQAGADQGVDGSGDGSGGGGEMSDAAFNDLCTSTVYPQMKSAIKKVKKKGGKAWKKGSKYDKTLNSLYKYLKSVGAVKMKKSTFKSKVKSCIDANMGESSSPKKSGSNKSPSTNYLTTVDLSSNLKNYKGSIFKGSTGSKVVVNKDELAKFQKAIKNNNDSVQKKQKEETKIGSFSATNINKAMDSTNKKDTKVGNFSGKKKNYQEQISSNLDVTNKEESGSDAPIDTTGKVTVRRTTQERVTKHITIAQCVVNDVYGSQLERVGEVAVGDPTNSWSMDADEFWTEDPSYYTSQNTGYVTVENKTSGDALSTSTYSADGSGNLTEDTSEDDSPDEALIFGFVRTKDSDYIGGETSFTGLTVQQKDLVHGYNTVPGHPEDKIDASLDTNNSGSKYAGQVPLVNFHLSADDETQRTKKSAKKHVILTQDDSTGENTIGTEEKKSDSQ